MSWIIVPLIYERRILSLNDEFMIFKTHSVMAPLEVLSSMLGKSQVRRWLAYSSSAPWRLPPLIQGQTDPDRQRVIVQ